MKIPLPSGGGRGEGRRVGEQPSARPSPSPPRARGIGLAALAFIFIATAAGLAAGASFYPVEPARLRPPPAESLILNDRNGRPLGEALTSLETSSAWVSIDRVSPYLVAAVVAVEDRRFWRHGGIDPLAVARAAWTNLCAGRVMSGASTITQQVARLILSHEARLRGEPPPGRTFIQKLREAHLAVRLERSFGKARILEAWLNRAPFGGVTVGVASAAERYFGASPAALDLARAALLAGVPHGPSALRPDRQPEAARRRRDRVLAALVDAGSVSPARAVRAAAEPVAAALATTRPLRPRLGAWVAKDLALLGRPAGGAVRSTIDLALEKEIVRIVRERLLPLRSRGARSAAVVVLDHATDELLALVGSADEADPRWGQVHAAFALRQPGSALKPFVYLAALEGGATLASLAADVEQAFPDWKGAYLPQNYDRRFHGAVRYREALAQSLNVAAVDVASRAGLSRVAGVLERAGISSAGRAPQHYGLGVALGSLDVQLLELTEAYAVLARGGVARPTRVLLDSPAEPARRVLDERHAYLVSHVLSDPVARAPQFGRGSVLGTTYWSAAKTGTSKGFRDNWCVGFSRRFAVGVWVGDPEGAPMRGVSGVAGAGPVWRAVMDLLHKREPSLRPSRPKGVAVTAVCPTSGLRPGPDCPGAVDEEFVAGTEPEATCAMHRTVRLARLDGLPLPPGCEAEAAPPRRLTLWPSPFDAWAVANGRGVPDAVSAACAEVGGAGRRARPRLLAPARDEEVRIDPEVPRERQQMLLLADVGGARGRVRFYVDGREVPSTVGARGALWAVEPGEHRIVARAEPGGLESDEHVVRVR